MVEETVIGPPGDFPIIPAKSQGRPYKTGWMLTMNPERQGPPVMGGPVLGMFDMLVRLDGMDTASPQVTQALPMQPGWCYNEPVHVPAATAGHDGWLVMMVDHQTGGMPSSILPGSSMPATWRRGRWRR
jgi:carotenoid cleavage dioxygenase